MTWSEHTAKAQATAVVQCPAAIVALTRAHDQIGAPRLENLHEAQEQLLQVLGAVQAAIAAELAAQPTASPTVARIRAVARRQE